MRQQPVEQRKAYLVVPEEVFRLERCEQELGASFDKTKDIPKGMEDDVAKYREALLEAVVELDDDIMMQYLEVPISS